jgi:hypothetical protein
MIEALQAAEQVFAKLEVSGETEIMVMLSRSGSVNRKGGMDDEHNPFCMGFVEEDLLGAFLEAIPEELMELAGRYTFPDPQGALCVLSIALEGKNLDTGFEFTYGEKSDGPPEEIVTLFELLLDLTDDWYHEQRAKKKRNK